MAKEQKPVQNPAPAPDASAVPVSPKSYRLYISLGLAGLILCQMIVLWLLLPSRNSIQEHTGSDPPPDVTQSSEPMVEISLQKDPFKVKQLRDEKTENLSLRMYVVVRKKESSKFTRQYEQSTQRVIDCVSNILYASSRAERQEQGRNAIKERLKKGINDVLGTPLVQEVLISEYSFSVDE